MIHQKVKIVIFEVKFVMIIFTFIVLLENSQSANTKFESILWKSTLTMNLKSTKKIFDMQRQFLKKNLFSNC